MAPTENHEELTAAKGEDAVTQLLEAKAFGLSIAVESADPELLADVLPWLPSGWRRLEDAESIDRRYVLSAERPEREPGLLYYALAIDGEQRYRSPSFAIFADCLEIDVHHYIATYTRGYLFVHAGVAVWQGQAIVAPGRSYAGKSTLIHALLEAGATYYSDDYAIIDHDGRVHPFPRHLRIRDQNMTPQLKVDPAARGWTIGLDPVPVGVVADLRFDRDGGWNVQEVSRGAGVLALLGNTVAARERPVDALAMMAKAVEQAKVLEGTRGEAEEAAQRLIAVVESR